MSLPTDPKARKATPITTGVLDYFPDALAAVAEVSRIGNEQHNPGEPLHWAKEKSTDHADCITRHLLDRGKLDTDGGRHSAKVAWRALAMLQIEIETQMAAEPLVLTEADVLKETNRLLVPSVPFAKCKICATIVRPARDGAACERCYTRVLTWFPNATPGLTG